MRLERSTFRVGVWHSIQLSYRRIYGDVKMTRSQKGDYNTKFKKLVTREIFYFGWKISPCSIFLNFLYLFATNKLHLSLYTHTASGNPRQAVVQFVRSGTFSYPLILFIYGVIYTLVYKGMFCAIQPISSGCIRTHPWEIFFPRRLS